MQKQNINWGGFAMKEKDPIVKGIEKVLSFLPDDLSEEEKAKVEEIRELLNKIEDKQKPKESDRDER